MLVVMLKFMFKVLIPQAVIDYIAPQSE